MCTKAIWGTAQHQVAAGKELFDVEQQDAVPGSMNGNKRAVPQQLSSVYVTI